MSTLPAVPDSLQKYLHTDLGPPQIKIDPNGTSRQKLMQGLQQGGISVIAPDGKPGFVHGSVADQFFKDNPTYKPAVVMTAPDGTPGLVARDGAADFLKANPTYQVGSGQNSLDRNPLVSQTQEIPGTNYRLPKFEQPNLLEKVYPPLGTLKALRNIRLAASLVAENARQEGQAPDAAPIVRNVVAPAGEAAAGFLGSQFEPANLATLGALKYLPTSTAPLRTLQRAAGAYFTGSMGIGAGKGAQAAYNAAKEGNVPEAVKQGVQAGLLGGMAAEGAYRTGQGASEAFRDLKATPGELVTSRPVQSLIQTRPMQYLAQKGRDVRSAVNVEKAGPVESATMAFRPRNSKYKWQQEAASALPDMRRAADSLGINPQTMTLQDAARATARAKRDVWKEYSDQFADPNSGDAVDTTPVANVIRSTVTPRMVEQNPGLADKINRIADTYEGRQIKLGDIEERMRELNNETAAIEARYPAQKFAAQSDPQNAYVFAERQALRNLADSKMNELSGPGASQLRQRYGALKSVEDVIQRRIPVVERQSPMPIGKLMARLYGVAKIGRGVFTGNVGDLAEGTVALANQAQMAKLNDPNFLTQQAFRKTVPRGPIPPAPTRVEGEYVDPGYVAPNRRGIRGLLPPITLPSEFPPQSNSVEAVGMPQTAEANALQNEFNANPTAFQRIIRRPVVNTEVPNGGPAGTQESSPVLRESNARTNRSRKAVAGNREVQAQQVDSAGIPDKVTVSEKGTTVPEMSTNRPQMLASADVSSQGLPTRTPDTMSEAIALSSPSGHMSERARSAANERLREKLFGKDGMQLKAPPPQPTKAEALRNEAKQLRDLADRGMKPRAFRQRAKELEAAAVLATEPQPSAQPENVSAAIRPAVLGQMREYGKAAAQAMKERDSAGAQRFDLQASRFMDTQPKEWRQAMTDAYNEARQAESKPIVQPEDTAKQKRIAKEVRNANAIIVAKNKPLPVPKMEELPTDPKEKQQFLKEKTETLQKEIDALPKYTGSAEQHRLRAQKEAQQAQYQSVLHDLEQSQRFELGKKVEPPVEVPKEGQNFEGRYLKASLTPKLDEWKGKLNEYAYDRAAKGKLDVTPPAGEEKLFVKVPGDGKFLIPNNPKALGHAVKAADKFPMPKEPKSYARSIPRSPKEYDPEVHIVAIEKEIADLRDQLKKAPEMQKQYLEEQLKAALENLQEAKNLTGKP